MRDLLRRALSARRKRKTVIRPKARPLLRAVARCTRSSGMGAVYQRKSPNHQGEDARGSKNPMGGEMSFQDQQYKSGGQQHHRGVAHRQQVQGKDREQHQDCAQGSGNDGAGGIELHIDEQCADHQHQDREVGIGEPVQNLFPQGWLNLDQPRVRGCATPSWNRRSE